MSSISSDKIKPKNKKPTIIDDYFNILNNYRLKYGNNTFLLMQVGSFFEAYQTLDNGFNLTTISNLLGITYTKKNKNIPEINISNPYMLGFPCPSLHKFLKILINNGLTVIIFEQKNELSDGSFSRELSGIYSYGTYVDDVSIIDNNYILSIYIEECQNVKKNNIFSYLIGISIIDVSTGNVQVCETYSKQNDEMSSFDDVLKIINSYNSNEILITYHNLNNINIKTLLSLLELDTDDKRCYINKVDENTLKIKYQQEILNRTYKFNNNNDLSKLNIFEQLDIEKYNYITISLVILLNYIYEHNKSLIKNLSFPIILDKQNLLYLGNNTLNQLNIINNGSVSNNYKSKYKCLFDVIDKTSTSMGKRFLKNQLINPLINDKELNFRYDLTEYLMYEKYCYKLQNLLSVIPDIEKFIRKISTENINPSDLFKFYHSLLSIQNLIINLIDNNIFNDFEELQHLININDINNLIAQFSIFDIEELQKYFFNDINGKIFINSFNPIIDNILIDINKCNCSIDKIAYEYNVILNNELNSKDQYIKIESNDKDGHYLSLTKRRGEILFKYLEKNSLLNNNIIFKTLPKGNITKIFINDIKNNSIKMELLINELKHINNNCFISFLKSFYNQHSSILSNLIYLINIIDFTNSNAIVSTENFYCRPVISNIYNNHSFINSTNLRHPIVEKIIDSQYIPNNINIHPNIDNNNNDNNNNDNNNNDDNGKLGMIIFGNNMVGKSTLIKAVATNQIMAQCGLFVAASSYTYYTYSSLFTRISDGDNMFKAQSSFGLEVSELNSILKRCNKNTLCISDEILHSSDYRSALIIVMSMIEIFSKSGCSFLTTSHLHDLVKLNRLKKLSNVGIYHLHTEIKNNQIIFHRDLRSGSGNDFYGLEISKHIINTPDFIKISSEIKDEVFNENLLNLKTSKYNSSLFMDKCQICNYVPSSFNNEIPLETHHIIFQKDCNDDGYIINDIRHKNHKSNLVCICSKCHDNIHNGKIKVNGYKDTVNGKILEIE